jgi:hypothetical protein
MLVQGSDNSYSLLVRVRSTGYSRIIDPSDSLLRLARGFKQESCKRKNLVNMEIATKCRPLRTFAEAAARNIGICKSL